jgi:hypothetical protein
MQGKSPALPMERQAGLSAIAMAYARVYRLAAYDEVAFYKRRGNYEFEKGR